MAASAWFPAMLAPYGFYSVASGGLTQETARGISPIGLAMEALSTLQQVFLVSVSAVVALKCFTSFWTLFFLVACAAAFLFGALVVLTLRIVIAPKHHAPKHNFSQFQEFIKKLQAQQSNRNGNHEPHRAGKTVLISRAFTGQLQHLLELVGRDFISGALQDVIFSSPFLSSQIKHDLWIICVNLSERMSKVDQVQFLTQDVVLRVSKHLEKLRCATSDKEKPSAFHVYPYLDNLDRERDFLRKLVEVVICLTFPRPYVDCLPVRHLLREILACQVLQPAIDQICDPDTINQHLSMRLKQRKPSQGLRRRSYAYAASYEDFVAMIDDCNDLGDLQQIRYNIVAEIAQATTISSLKRSKGMDLDKEFVPQGVGKGDLLQARNLKRYIKQLSFAKLQCERRMRVLGGSNLIADPHSDPINVAIPSFKTVMRDPQWRRQFVTFLQQSHENADLVEFWSAVQDIRKTSRKIAFPIAGRIFYTYCYGSNPSVKVDKGLFKDMESFLLGDKGPDAFFQAQDQVHRFLEERHYPSFVVSQVKMPLSGAVDEVDATEGDIDGQRASTPLSSDGDDEGTHKVWSERSHFARSRLEQLDLRLSLKKQALEALISVAPLENPLVATLEKEIEGVEKERRQLESWQAQVETWMAHLGDWKAFVLLPHGEEDKECVRFPVQVTRQYENIPGQSSPVLEPESWLVHQSVADFHALHTKLSQAGTPIKGLELPPLLSKSLFNQKADKVYLEKTRTRLQYFLEAILNDERLYTCETVFTFLIPTPDCLKRPTEVPKKPRFFLSNIFGSDLPAREKENSDEDNVDVVEGIMEPDIGSSNASSSLKEDDALDGIAEPLYGLLAEVFELRGVFRWLRRTLVTFVQITYGRTINRQLREMVTGLVSESAALKYVQLFTQTFWGSNGTLLPPTLPRSPKEQMDTRIEARELLLAHVPDVLCQLVGQQSARRGVVKVFEALQSQHLNKQLFYDVLDVMIRDLFPEILPR